MISAPNPEILFVEFLFERLLYERVLARNSLEGCCIDPEAMADKFDYILHYYRLMGLKQTHKLRSEAIGNLGLNVLSGVVIFMTNMRGRYKVFPASVATSFVFGSESEDTYDYHIHSQHMSNKQIKEFKRDSAAKIPEDYQSEIDLLVRILKDNGLMSAGDCGEDLEKNLDVHNSLDDIDDGVYPEDRYITKLEELLLTKPAPKSPKRKDADAVKTTESTKALDAAAAYSSPEMPMTMAELSNLLRKTGYKSVEFTYRYLDMSCDINAPYTSFVDLRSELSCQITMAHPLGTHVQGLVQAYADVDDRLERLVYAAQQITDEHGRCKRFLSNYALTLMVIAFLQSYAILPRLQHHRKFQPAQMKAVSAGTPDQKQQSTKVKTNKNARKRQHRRLRDLSQITTLSGSTRYIDCRFDKSLAQNWSKHRKTDESVGELLEKFLDYFISEHDYTQHEVSPVDGTMDHPRNLIAPNSRSYMVSNTNSDISHSISSNKSNDSQSNVGNVKTSNTGKQTGLIVRDPFADDRNVTRLCSGWKLRATLQCFRRAHKTLTKCDDLDLADSDFDGDLFMGRGPTYNSDDYDDYTGSYDDPDDSSDLDDDDSLYGDGSDGCSDDIPFERRQWQVSRSKESKMPKAQSTSFLILAANLKDPASPVLLSQFSLSATDVANPMPSTTVFAGPPSAPAALPNKGPVSLADRAEK
ncbi:hypothetical protein BGX28_006826 [Mortierella sp. GBA30]|nr:hypothetical protein BGX28_006826 [Mortierella sp. GBA30]